MPRCELCNAEIPFLKGGNPIIVGEVCDDCYRRYLELKNAVNSANRESFEKQKADFMTRAQTPANKNAVEKLFSFLEKKIVKTENAKSYAEAYQKNYDYVDRVPIVTTETYEGYKIGTFRHLLSATVLVGIGASLYSQYGNDYTLAVEAAKKEAVMTLKYQALEKECNAVVGLRFSFFDLVTQGDVRLFISAEATGVKLIAKEG